MPLYTYRCPDCGYETDVLQTYLAEVVCKCGVSMERKFPSNIMIKMKGEGGYPSRRKQIFNTTNRIHPKLD